MEERRYFRNTYAQPAWYKYDYGFTLFVMIAWAILSAGMAFALYAATAQLLHFGFNGVINTMARLLAVLMFSYGLFLMATTLYSYIFHAVEVTFKGSSIEGKGIFGLSWKMDLSEIAHIRGEAKFYFWRLVLESQDGTKKIRITPAIQDTGEMMERILREAENYETVELGKLPKTWKAWNKEPDWQLIEEAKARAEENRKKRIAANRIEPE